MSVIEKVFFPRAVVSRGKVVLGKIGRISRIEQRCASITFRRLRDLERQWCKTEEHGLVAFERLKKSETEFKSDFLDYLG